MRTYTVTYEIQNTRIGAVVTSKQTTDATGIQAIMAVTQLLDHEDESWTRIRSVTITINHGGE